MYIGSDASKVQVQASEPDEGNCTKYSGKIGDNLVFEIVIDSINTVKRYHCYKVKNELRPN